MSNFSNYNNVDKNNSNNLRMMEINEYYSKRNIAFIEIFKIIIIGSILLIAIAILAKTNIIPRQITTFLSLIILFILGILCFIKFYSILRRDPRNFDNFIIPFNANQTILENAGESSSMSKILSKEFDGLLGCFDSNCCSKGMKFDSHKRKCVLEPSEIDSSSKNNNINTSANNVSSKKDNSFIDSIGKLTNINSAESDLNDISNDMRNFTLENIDKEI